MIKEKALVGFKWTSSSTFIVSSIQIIQLLIVANFLSPKDFGLVAIVTTILHFVKSFSDLGVSAAIIHKQVISEIQLSSLFWLNIIIGLIFFGISIASADIVARIFKEPEIENIYIAISFLFIIIPLGTLFQVLLQKELEFKILAFQDILSSVLGGLTTIVLAIYGFGYWALVIGFMFNTIVRSVLFFIVGIRQFKVSYYLNLKEIKDYLKFGFYQMGERGINFLNERLDQLVIGYFLGASSLGFYSFAYNIVSQPIVILNPIFTKVAFPVFAKLQKNKNLLGEVYLKLLKYISLLNVPILMGIIIISPVSIPLFFGVKWNNSVILVQLLSIVSIFKIVGNPSGSLILAVGKANIGFYWNLFVLTLTIPVVIIGAKSGNLIVFVLGLIFLQIFLIYPSYKVLIWRYTDCNFKNYVKSFFKPIIYSSLMAISTIFYLFEIEVIIRLIFMVVMGIIIYFGFLLRYERTELWQLFNLLFKKKINLG